MPRRRPVGPILALLLAAGLGAWVYLKEIKGEKTGGKEDTAKTRPVSFERADLKAIRIKNAHGEVRLEKAGETWKISEPLAAETDKDAVESLLGSLEMARIDRRLGTVTDLKTYGLDPPQAVLTVTLAKGGESPILSLGDGSPVGGNYFALLPGGKELAVVSSSLGDLSRKDLLSLRDKSLLALDPWKVKRLRIERGWETVLLEKPDDGWKVQQPLETPADGPTVTDLLSALERLRASSFESEKPGPKDLRQHALDPPSARLTILQEGWDIEKTVLFGRKPDGTLYARTVGRDPIVAIPKDFWEKVTTKVADLRRKEILGVGQYRLQTITAARAGKPALVLTREKDGSWSLSGLATGTVKSSSLDTLLSTLGSLKAQSFDDHPTEALLTSLARSPALDLILQEEVEASGAAGKSQHLVFGSPDRSGGVRVRDMAWRPISIVGRAPFETINSQLDAILKEAAEVKKPSASPSTAPGQAPATPAPSPARP